MDTRRWEQISAIFRAALERAPGERACYLAEVCGDDASLRGEVSSLLSAYGAAEGFMDAPAVEAAGRMLAEGESLEPGEQFGAYKILGPVGAGGMGTVYLAEDERLNRRVALKVLSAEFASDRDRARRFEQEARAASSLNHPNILTVYEFGRAAGQFFLAAEYVEGRTLRRLLEESGGFGTDEALNVAAQVAEALAAAHAAGVIHRDIKPENVVLRPDKYIKVLDFGLAKLTERRAGLVSGGGGVARETLDTSPGMIVGTAKYMSPEQARGLPVDERTDVWSLGCVLHEMIRGRAPFGGATPADVLAAVLEREPPSLEGLAPEGVVRLVEKALAKDRAERFQSMEELAAELRELQTHAGRPGRPSDGRARGAAARSLGDAFGARTRRLSADDTNPTVVQETGEERAASAPVPHRLLTPRTFSLTLAVLLFVSACVGLAVRYNSAGPQATAAAPPSMTPPAARFRRLTDIGLLYDPAISPDGRFIAYVVRDRDKSSITLRPVASFEETVLVPAAEANRGGLAFSPDGRYLYFGASVHGKKGGTIYRVPVEGGTPRTLAEEVMGAFGISPDGGRLAFVREDAKQAGRMFLVVQEIESGSEREIGVREGSSYYQIFSVGPSWSPDGGRLVIPAGEWPTEGPARGKATNYYLEVNVADGSERRIPTPEWESIDQACWLSDGGLVVLAQESKSAPFQVWMLDERTGAARRITNDLENYGRISLTADTRQIVATKHATNATLWLLPRGETRRARQLTFGQEAVDGYYGLTWTPDGRIAYASNEATRRRLWSIAPDGGERRPLTGEEEELNSFPSYSPADGRIIYGSTRGGGLHVWAAGAVGGEPRQLTDSAGEVNPRVAPDGRSVVYVSTGDGPWSLWRKPLDGGEAVKLLDGGVGLASFSPDGSRILVGYYDPDERARTRWKLAVIPAEGGRPERLFEIAAFRLLAEWAPDGRGFYYIENAMTVSNLWLQPLSGGPPRRVTDFETERIFNFAWSADHEQLVVARGSERVDAILISDFR